MYLLYYNCFFLRCKLFQICNNILIIGWIYMIGNKKSLSLVDSKNKNRL